MTQKGRSLTHRTAAGVAWLSVFQVSKQVLQVVSVSVLARHIPPAAYGLMAMAVLVTNFLETVRDVGTGQALIREKIVSQEFASTVSWINMFLGTAVTLLVVGLSWPASWFFHQPELAPVLRVLAISFFLGALNVVPRAMLSRELLFKEVALAQTAGVVCGTIVAITLAIAGFGVWSLVFGAVTNALTTTIACRFYTPFQLKFVFQREDARKVLHFGLNLSGFQMLNYMSRNADNLLVGKFLGSGPLGFYQMAYSLMTYPIQNFTAQIGQVVYPAISKFHDDHERFRSAYLRTVRIIALATFPLMMGLAAVATPFVRVFLGARWLPVADLLVIFGPLGALQSIIVVIMIYNAQGRPDLNFRWTMFASTMYVLSFIVGLRWGINGVAICYAIVWTVLMVPSLLIPFRLIGLTLSAYFKAIWPTVWMSLTMSGICKLWLIGLQRQGVRNPLVQVLTAVGLGAIIYVGLLKWRKPPVLAELGAIVGASKHPVARLFTRFLSVPSQPPALERETAAGSAL